MPRKIQDITRATLEAVPLPVHAATYTVISHKSIMDYALAEIAAMGFTVQSEEYRATHDGQIAQGIYQLNYNSDPEMSLMFAWTNSYNKQIRFKCATGGYVNANQTVMLAGELGSYARKHTGTADADVIASMQVQITNATMYYNQLVKDKEVMKTINLSSRKQAELLGILFAEYEVLTTEQASIIRQQMDKPSFFYNGGKDTLWAFYNHVTVALQHSHPRSWMEDQRMLHWVISNEFDLSAPVQVVSTPAEELSTPVDPLYEVPNQTNILDQIAEVEVEEEPLSITLSEAVEYTDTQGNTFELPSIEAEVAPQRVKFAIDEEEVPSLEPTPEEHEIFEAEQVVSMDTISLNEDTKIAVVVNETEQEDDDFGFSFDLGDESGDNDLFL